MARLLLTIKHQVESSPEPLTALSPDRLAEYEAEYDALIAQGLAANPPPEKRRPRARGRPKQTPPKNLLDRLHKYKSGVLAFMYDFRIPFDNNQVERDARMIKAQQKVSGSFRTQEGADTLLNEAQVRPPPAVALRPTVPFAPVSQPRANTVSMPLTRSAMLSLTSPSSLPHTRLSRYEMSMCPRCKTVLLNCRDRRHPVVDHIPCP